jgi:predicted AAA+ superfamily ATPase
MDMLRNTRDKQIIKAIVGVRRCGKSTLLKLFQDYLLNTGVPKERILSINFEDEQSEPLRERHGLHDYVLSRLADGQMTYVFLDEIQYVPDFQLAVASLFLRENIDIYMTGSNDHLLSGDLATRLTGRYILVKMLPLSFKEFLALNGGDKRDAFDLYCKRGAFPQLSVFDDEVTRSAFVEGIFNTIIVKDIVTKKRISDMPLLEAITLYLADNIGNMVSSKKIADTLVSNGRKTTVVTVEHYINALCDAYILYKAPRFEVKGKLILKSLEKYYLSDISFRHYLIGDATRDVGRILENIVYLELLRRGYRVYVGKVGQKEVDFVATKYNDKLYVQVAHSLAGTAVLDRELGVFDDIHDNYPKYLVSMDENCAVRDGYKHFNVIDYLLEEW